MRADGGSSTLSGFDIKKLTRTLNSSDSSNGEDDGVFNKAGLPLFDVATHTNFEYKKYLRLQKEGLVNLKEIFVKM